MNVKVINVQPLQGNTVAPPLALGDVREVKQIHTCGCNEQHYDVGLTSDYNYVTCHLCREVLPNSAHNGIHWCSPGRFVEV